MNQGRYKNFSFTRARAAGAVAALALGLAAAVLGPVAAFGEGSELAAAARTFRVSQDDRVRAESMAVLRAAGLASLEPLLAQDAETTGQYDRRLAQFVSEFGPKAVVRLIALLPSPELGVRAGNVLSLAVTAGPDAPVLELLACTRAPGMSAACGPALVRAAGPKSPGASELAAALLDVDPMVRAYVSAALGQWGPSGKAAVPALIIALKDPVPAVRWSAAKALGAIGKKAKKALPELDTLASDTDPEVRRRAVEAARKIRG